MELQKISSKTIDKSSKSPTSDNGQGLHEVRGSSREFPSNATTKHSVDKDFVTCLTASIDCNKTGDATSELCNIPTLGDNVETGWSPWREDATDELDDPDYSVEFYQRLFYPRLPCRQCSYCLRFAQTEHKQQSKESR